MTITHNQIVKLLRDLATNHYQINGFGFGDPWEYLASNTPATPCLWGILNNTQRTKREVTLSYSLLIFDLVKINEDNEDEVLSDTQQIALDILAMLGSPTYTSQFILGDSSQMEDFTERFDSKVAGWKMDITIRIPFDNDVCQVPASGLPSLENTYEVTVYDQNGNIVTTVPCGGSYSVIVASGIDEGNSTQTYTNQVLDI
jgi:hypothetical protein